MLRGLEYYLVVGSCGRNGIKIKTVIIILILDTAHLILTLETISAANRICLVSAPSNNLYNTNREFDWGAFRSLAEEAQLASASSRLFLFFYQFDNPGTYVLRLSSNQHKRMVCPPPRLGHVLFTEQRFQCNAWKHLQRCFASLLGVGRPV